MITDKKEFYIKGLNYVIRSAIGTDALELSRLRLQIDGETENLDREKGEAFLNEEGFRQLIHNDSEDARNLFLVSAAGEKLVGFSRCQGNSLKRLSHKVEFGICVLKEYWGYGIGKNLLKESVTWADTNNIKKITLSVLETNEKAIHLYQRFGFEVEGVLKKDKILSDGKFYDTVIMGRFNDYK
jgi:RimJ/RimL family protein N-acetyltransferase